MAIDLNAVMSLVANGPAAVAATVGGIRYSSIYHSSLILYLLDRSLSCRSPLSQFLNKCGDFLVSPFNAHRLVIT